MATYEIKIYNHSDMQVANISADDLAEVEMFMAGQDMYSYAIINGVMWDCEEIPAPFDEDWNSFWADVAAANAANAEVEISAEQALEVARLIFLGDKEWGINDDGFSTDEEIAMARAAYAQGYRAHHVTVRGDADLQDEWLGWNFGPMEPQGSATVHKGWAITRVS